MTQRELAEKIGYAPSVVNEVLHEKRKISADMAVRLESVMYSPASYWLRLQSIYDERSQEKRSRRSRLTPADALPVCGKNKKECEARERLLFLSLRLHRSNGCGVQRVHSSYVVCKSDGVYDDALGDFGDLYEGNVMVVKPAPDGAFRDCVAGHHKAIDLCLRAFYAAMKQKRVGDVDLHGRERREQLLLDMAQRNCRLIEALVAHFGNLDGRNEFIGPVDAVDIDGDVVFNCHFFSPGCLHADAASEWKYPLCFPRSAKCSRSAPSR